MNDKAVNVWQVLGIEPTNSKKEIKKAYASLAKDCHPEEQPEKFEVLSEAYKTALAHAKMSTNIDDSKQNMQKILSDAIEHVMDEVESVADKQEEMQHKEEGELLALIKEQKKQDMTTALSIGIMKDIVELLENEKICNKPKMWSEVFVKDEFLKVQCDDNFLELLQYYLISHTEGFSKPLPQAFITEIAIAYAISLYENGYAFEEQYVNGQSLIARIWNSQPQDWIVNRGCRILWRDLSEAKRHAYQAYFELKNGCIRDEIHVDEISNTNTLWDAGSSRKFYEMNKNGDKLEKFQASAIIIKLYDYLLRSGIIPFDLVCYFYERWNLRENEISNEKGIYYKDIKNTILTLYPNIENHMYKDEKLEKTIKKWVYSVSKYQHKYNELCKQGEKYYQEPDEIIKAVEECFNDQIWLEYCAHPIMLEMWNVEYWYFYWPLESISKELYKVYSNRKFDKNPDVQKLLTKIMWGLLLVEREKGLERDRFLPYFIMYGFGITFMPIGPHAPCAFDNVFIREDFIYLPEYINHLYAMEDYIPKKKEYEFDLKENGCLRIKCNPHSVEYTLNGEDKYPRSIPYEKFKHMVENVSDIKAFFALFALADIDIKNREDAKKLVREWLYKTSLLEGNYEVIIECLVNGDPIWKNGAKLEWQDNEEEGLLIKETSDTTMTYKYSTMGWFVLDLTEGNS